MGLQDFFFFFFPPGSEKCYFFFVSRSHEVSPYFSKMGFGKGTVGGAGSPEVIVQAETEHYNGNFRPRVSF